jgi:hypothetical protein
MNDGLKQGIREFMMAGRLAEKSSLLIAATDNYFKALIHATDFYLANLFGKI